MMPQDVDFTRTTFLFTENNQKTINTEKSIMER